MSGRLYWILGIAVALAGVAVVRLVAPNAESGRIAWTLAGNGIALAGLFTIALGTRRKYATPPAADPGTGETKSAASP
ncbi:MAG TPA: hypothetical protein VGK67_36975 [Myxococcales bacterium]|jgi:hypothetical protein